MRGEKPRHQWNTTGHPNMVCGKNRGHGIMSITLHINGDIEYKCTQQNCDYSRLIKSTKKLTKK
jgi:hypothetical protein